MGSNIIFFRGCWIVDDPLKKKQKQSIEQTFQYFSLKSLATSLGCHFSPTIGCKVVVPYARSNLVELEGRSCDLPQLSNVMTMLVLLPSIVGLS